MTPVVGCLDARLQGRSCRASTRALPLCVLCGACTLAAGPLLFLQVLPARTTPPPVDGTGVALPTPHSAGGHPGRVHRLSPGTLFAAAFALIGLGARRRAASASSRLPARSIAGEKWTSSGDTVWVLHENVASITGDDFCVKNEEGDVVIKANAAVFNIKDSIELIDAETEEEVCTIKQEILHLSPTYRITREGEVVATVRKDRFSPVYKTIRVYEGNADFNPVTNSTDAPCLLQLNGGMISSRKTYVYNGDTEDQIADVKEKSWTPGSFFGQDDYGVNVQDGGDVALILAAMIVKDELTETEEAAEE